MEREQLFAHIVEREAGILQQVAEIQQRINRFQNQIAANPAKASTLISELGRLKQSRDDTEAELTRSLCNDVAKATGLSEDEISKRNAAAKSLGLTGADYATALLDGV